MYISKNVGMFICIECTLYMGCSSPRGSSPALSCLPATKPETSQNIHISRFSIFSPAFSAFVVPQP